MAQSCIHANMIAADVVPGSADVCLECLERGDSWVHLRICLTCGHVGCCDDSKNRHARAHFHQSGHPVVQSYEPREIWRWCFVDEVMLPAARVPYRR